MNNPYVLLKFVGTDAYLMHSFMPHMSFGWRIKVLLKRMLVKFLDRFVIQEYIVDHENLADHLTLAGLKKPKRVFCDPVWHPLRMEKKNHKGFNIVYYDPSKWKKNKKAIQWRFGIDIVENLKKAIPDANFICIDGSQDMSMIWPIADFYLRPCRVDGASRLRQEAEINNVPYYWTYRNPSERQALIRIIESRKSNQSKSLII